MVNNDYNLFFYDFETGTNFTYYFPENNMEKVMQKLKICDVSLNSPKKSPKKRKFTKSFLAKENELIISQNKDLT